MIDCNHEALLWVADTSEVPDPDPCPDRLTRGYTPHGIFTASIRDYHDKLRTKPRAGRANKPGN